MYSVNGVPLDNEALGWRLLRRSQPLTPVSKRVVDVVVPGRSGSLPGIPSTHEAPTITLVVRLPGASLEALYATFERNGGVGTFSLTDDTTRAATFELLSLSPQGLTGYDELVDVSVTFRIPGAAWRAVTRSTMDSTSVTAPVQEFEYFSGIGAPIMDADVFVGGNFGNFQLRDQASGSWVGTSKTWPHVSGTGLLFVGATGQAFRANTSAPWTPISDMSGYVDVSGSGFFISPTWDTDPSATLASLELTTTSQSGVTFRVRGYNAYQLRDGGA